MLHCHHHQQYRSAGTGASVFSCSVTFTIIFRVNNTGQSEKFAPEEARRRRCCWCCCFHQLCWSSLSGKPGNSLCSIQRNGTWLMESLGQGSWRVWKRNEITYLSMLSCLLLCIAEKNTYVQKALLLAVVRSMVLMFYNWKSCPSNVELRTHETFIRIMIDFTLTFRSFSVQSF